VNSPRSNAASDDLSRSNTAGLKRFPMTAFVEDRELLEEIDHRL